MEPRGQPSEIPINIDSNAWQIVLRDGVPTLVPKRYAEPPNLTALVRTQNGNTAAQNNLLITQRAYEQELALDYASQTTPLSQEQHQFLRDKLQALRGTIDHLTNNIDARRQVTMSYENAAGTSQSASSSTANTLANTFQTQTSFSQPNQQAPNVNHTQNSVFYNVGTQSVTAGVPRQAESANGMGFRTYPQGTTGLLPNTQSTNRQSFQSNPSSNSGGLPRTDAMPANVPSRSTHQRQTSSQGLANQRQQIFQQSQQTYVGLSQLPNAAPPNTYHTHQSQTGSARAISNASIPQKYVQNTSQQPVANTSRVQAGVPYPNGSQADYQTQWLRASQVNNQQTPARPQNIPPQAHISPASQQNTPVRPTSQSNPLASAQINATNSAAPRAIVPSLHPQQSQGTSRPTNTVVPPAPAPTQPQPQSRPHINSFAFPQTVLAPPMSATAQMLSGAIQNTDSSAFRKPQPSRQPNPSAVPATLLAPRNPPAVSAPFPVPSATVPPVPVEALEKNDVSIKEEPIEEVSLAQAILQHYGKRKAMDSAGSPGPANKRRAMGTDIAGERQAVDIQTPVVPSGWMEEHTVLMDESGLVDEIHQPEVLDDFIFSETAPDIAQANVNAVVEEPTSAVDQLPGDEVPMTLAEFDGLVLHITPHAQSTAFVVDSVMNPPPNGVVDHLLRVDILSDEMNVPETLRSPSAARISSVSETSEVPAKEPVEDGVNHSEAEVGGAIMVEVESNEHQLTPAPERNSSELPQFLPEDERGERGAAPPLRSPSIPVFKSIVDRETGKGKGKATRSRSPSEPLFLPMPSSSSSDAEIVEKPLQKVQKKGTTATDSFKGPRRQFLGVVPPFVLGASSRRVPPKKMPQFRSRISRKSPLSTASESQLSQGELTSTRLRRRPLIADSDNESLQGELPYIRSRRERSFVTDSENESLQGELPYTRSRRGRPRTVSSNESDNGLTEQDSGTRPFSGYNGLVNDPPYAVLNPTPCLWAHCDAVLDSLMRLMNHVEVVHTKPQILQSEQSDAIPRCRWDGCRRRTWAWCDEGGSSKLLRHVIKHIGPEMSCTIDGCEYSTKDREKYRHHRDEAHKGDQNLRLKPSTIVPNIIPREPTQSLPDFAPASEALFLAIYGDSSATLKSRPPSPQATSQAMSTMPLSPTKHSPRWRETEERTTDEYSFLDPFYPPSLYMDDLEQNAMEFFELECYDLVEDQSMRSMSDEP